MFWLLCLGKEMLGKVYYRLNLPQLAWIFLASQMYSLSMHFQGVYGGLGL
jgi:hypothetical protein